MDEGICFAPFKYIATINIMLLPQFVELLLDLVNSLITVNSTELLINFVTGILCIIFLDHLIPAFALFRELVKHLINDVVLAGFGR